MKKIKVYSKERGIRVLKPGVTLEQYLEADHTYQIKGTIKGHSEYNGAKETILTRVKIIKEI